MVLGQTQISVPVLANVPFQTNLSLDFSYKVSKFHSNIHSVSQKKSEFGDPAVPLNSCNDLNEDIVCSINSGKQICSIHFYIFLSQHINALST